MPKKGLPGIDSKKRCAWISDSRMAKYHDTEWGVPLFDDRKLFEFLVLDAFQAGLSWAIILNKRSGFRKAFHNFNPAKISKYTARDKKRLLSDAGIIRNRAKIAATIANARQFLKTQEEFGSFASYIWQFTGHKRIDNKFNKSKQIPPRTRHSDAMSEDLKSRGFKFVGSTICYAFMQAAGMVNDHLTHCFRYKECNRIPLKLKKPKHATAPRRKAA
ncbi:MAG: DNA-3-methyladenine glycosylase I [candidate division Zixibacteria bacterium]|nr:DNA-3-methyladenine glycosylase I [candidate division Zixibacteria bacterium]